MPATQRLIVHPFSSPLDSTSAPTAVPVGGVTGLDNGEYVISQSGQGLRYSIRKRLGTARYNSTAISTSTFTAIQDFWRYGGTLSPTQRFLACAGGGIYKDDGDAIWDLLGSGFGSDDAESYITTAGDYAVFSNDANQAAKKYDGTTLSDLTSSGNPKFLGSVYHLQRLWTFGEQTTASGIGNPDPSRCTISAAGDITDFTGADTGNLLFGSGDGDILKGISQPFRGRLYFFKGPNHGSIWEVQGNTLATFQRSPSLKAAPCVSHGSIITTTNDIYWASRYGFHSLQATQKFGDTEESYLSHPIQADFNRLNKTRLDQIRGFHHPTRNIVGWICPDSGSLTNKKVFIWNYAIGGWSIWTLAGFSVASVMVALTPSTQVPRLYLGGTNGYMYAGDQTRLADENADTAYSLRIKSPSHLRMPGKDELTEASFQAFTPIIEPTGDVDMTLAVSVDGRSQSYTVSLGGANSGDLIGSTFIMGTSKIAAESSTSIVPHSIEDRGRSVQATMSQSGLNEDFRLAGYAIDYIPAETVSREIT
jgi:hypothetical protein